MQQPQRLQELLHGSRYSESYSESLPDFVKLAEAYGAKGIRCSDPDQLDAVRNDRSTSNRSEANDSSPDASTASAVELTRSRSSSSVVVALDSWAR